MADSPGVLTVGEDDPDLTETLDRALTAFNEAATGPGHECALSVRVTDDAGLVGGLTGWTWGDCAGISMVWVRDDARGTGVGRRLLEAAEDVARERGCTRVFVSSFTFQAPDFYRAHGYVEVARVPDLLVEGAADVWFVKRFG